MSDVFASENPRATMGGNLPPPLRAILAEKYEPLNTAIEGILERHDNAPVKVASDADDAFIGAIVVDARKVWKQVEDSRDAEGRPHLEAKREIDGYFKGLGERIERVIKDLERSGKAYRDEKIAAARRQAEAEAREREAEAARQRKLAEDEATRGRPNAAARHADKADEEQEAALAAAASANARAADIPRHRTDGVTASTRTEWAFEITDYAAIAATLGPLGPYLARDAIDKAVRAYVRIHKNTAPLAGVKIFEDAKARYK